MAAEKGIITLMHELVSFILGILQGLTEFIPVSSSGHLVLAERFFGTADHKFIEFINIGTLAALLVYYRHRLVGVYEDIVHDKNHQLLRNVLLTSIPAGLAGLVLSNVVATHPFFINVYTVLVALALVGVVMIVLERLPKKAAVKSGAELPWYSALLVGFAQMFALVPGVSRSGSTIIASRLLGLKPAQAAEYSFLASIPIMTALTLKLFIHSEDRAYFLANLPGMLLGNAAAFVVGLLAIGFLICYLQRNDLKVFGWYRVGLSAVVLTVLLLQSK